jgi:hypothetical protein
VFQPEQLVDPVANLARFVLGEQTESRQLIMAQAADAFGVRAAQHVGDVRRAVALLAAHHTGEDFLRDDFRLVDRAQLAQAHIARAAALGFGQPALAEVLGQELVPANRAAGEEQHLRQARQGSFQIAARTLDAL